MSRAVVIEVRAKPNARESRIAGMLGSALVVHLAAPPVEGAANEELIATMARALGIPKRDVSIVRGAASRTKWIEVQGLSAAAVQERLPQVNRTARR